MSVASSPVRIRLWIDGQWVEGAEQRPIRSPFDGEFVAEADQATEDQVEAALAATQKAFGTFSRISRYSRSRLLALMAQKISARRAEFTDRIVAEAGKPWTLADGEVARAIQTFTVASEEARRMAGVLIPLDWDAAGREFEPAEARWFARGPVLAITPFNFPLNLAAHKVAPALAVGATVILKPPPQAPGASMLLAEVFSEAAREASDAREQIPLAALQVLQAPNDTMARAVEDPRIQILSFTGSDRVGWMLQRQAVRKRLCLELGGNASVIVHSDADLGRAAARCAFGGFAYAGQICISVQRILVHASVAEQFESAFLAEVSRVVTGDPRRKETLAGPVIDAANADRILEWVDEARRSGARVLTGGTRQGNLVAPTVLSGARSIDRVTSEEVFGPVVVLERYERIEQAIESVNASRYGLQAGVFTADPQVIRAAADQLEVGGVIVNEVPTYRADHMPYGGVKDSGLGREGLRYAMEEFSERKIIATWRG